MEDDFLTESLEPDITDDNQEDEFTKKDFKDVMAEGDKISKRRVFPRDKAKLRNLRQYKNLPDDEFEEKVSQLQVGVSTNKEFEGRIRRKIDNFSEDYDLTELNSNDKLQLRALAQAMITLEDYEIESYKLRGKGITLSNISLLEKLQGVMSELRKDISNLQDDLKITRKVRKADKEQTTITFIEDLKQKAREFYKNRMAYVFCPKCNTLLATIWFLYPEDKNTKVTLFCEREFENGEHCNTKFTVLATDLLKNKGTNKPDLLPDSML